MQVSAYIYTYPTNQKLLTDARSWHIGQHVLHSPRYMFTEQQLNPGTFTIMSFNSISTHYRRISKKNKRPITE
jgi:hypothetical protein